MLECDKQAVLIFLRNTSFGPTYTFNLTDPKTNKNFEYTHDLSNVSMKEFNLIIAEVLFTIILVYSGRQLNKTG